MRNSLQINASGALLVTLLLWGGTPPEAPVADAAMRGDSDAVQALVAGGADVNAAQGDGMTGLHWAAERGDEQIAEILIRAAAELNAVTRLGAYTPLHLASRGGHTEVVLELLEAGADARARTSTGGATALHFAAAAGRAEAIRPLLQHGADVNAREMSWGQTPLMFAASAGRTDAVRALLESGADYSITATMIVMAEREAEDRADQQQSRSRAEQAQQLLGPQPGLRPQQPGGGQPTAQDRARAMREQAQRGDAGGRAGGRGAQAYNQDQPDPDRPPEPLGHAQLIGGYGGLTALLMAVRDGQEDAALALVDAGADIDQRSAGDATTPLLMATINGHFDIALELLARGADPSLMSDAGATPLYTALNTQWIPKSRHPQPAAYMQQEASYLDVMKALLDAGVDPNVRLQKQLWYTTFGRDMLSVDRMGATAFWRAAYALDIQAMELLVAYGADPSTPTMHAPSRFGRRGGGGGDPSGLPPAVVGGPAVYPIHAASGVGYGEGYAGNIHRHVPDAWVAAVKYLVEVHGADVNARDNDGYSPVHHAAARGDNELILYLVEQGADVTGVSRRGQTTVDMANGPVQRISPFPETIKLLESLGAVNNHNCVSC
jgi:ankyrin repeat protein